ncbi:uncharacterized protein LOC112272017 [Brachypodium distachyon]|uniref:uncharacterized protein LOC112272017 n=1 Tax=Brachypodium distachyon TaxID=15368 RepID=UPI000D0E0F38|nr:uncharacterized protein LOC112272017 [Brachypodium distachyon]|eukprot:XP_024318277.1 uncharacterized protein LOC112272017 [Brachypodium distachyon]
MNAHYYMRLHCVKLTALVSSKDHSSYFEDEKTVQKQMEQQQHSASQSIAPLPQGPGGEKETKALIRMMRCQMFNCLFCISDVIRTSYFVVHAMYFWPIAGTSISIHINCGSMTEL